MSRACLHRQIHEQRGLRLFNTSSLMIPGAEECPSDTRSERGTPPATPPTRGPWQVQTSRQPKPLRFSVRLSADHPTPILMHAGRRPGRETVPPPFFSSRASHRDVSTRHPHPPFGHLLRQREKARARLSRRLRPCPLTFVGERVREAGVRGSLPPQIAQHLARGVVAGCTGVRRARVGAGAALVEPLHGVR